VADAVEDFDAAYLAEAGEDFAGGKVGFEEFQVFVEDIAGFVEDDEEEGGFEDAWFDVHFLQVGDDGVAPLRAVAVVADAAFAELVSDFDFEPEGFFGCGGIGGVEERGGSRVEAKGAAEGRKDHVAALAMGEFLAGRGGVVNFAGDLVLRHEALGEKGLELALVANVEAVDGLLEAEVGFGG